MKKLEASGSPLGKRFCYSSATAEALCLAVESAGLGGKLPEVRQYFSLPEVLRSCSLWFATS